MQFPWCCIQEKTPWILVITATCSSKPEDITARVLLPACLRYPLTITTELRDSAFSYV